MAQHFPAIDYERVKYLSSQGLTQSQIAASLGMSRSTIQNRLGTGNQAEGDQEFIAAFDAGRAGLAQEVLGLLLQQGREGSTQALSLLLNNVLGFSKNNKTEVDANLKVAPSLRIVLHQNLPDGSFREVDTDDAGFPVEKLVGAGSTNANLVDWRLPARV